MDKEMEDLNNSLPLILVSQKELDVLQAEIKKLEKLIAEGMNVIPINKDVLKNPTALLNWRTKVITYFKHKEEVI